MTSTNSIALTILPALALILPTLFACGSTPATTPQSDIRTITAPPLMPAPEPVPVAKVQVEQPEESPQDEETSLSTPLSGPDDACPEDMIYVEVDYCDKLKQSCVRKGKFDRSNHPPICAEYSKNPTCAGKTSTLRFCIDRFEFPNKKGAHPPVMVSAFDATAMCHEQGKRLCWEREWTAACEGARHEPYPYGGYHRRPEMCRVDEPWIKPIPERMVSKDRRIKDAEMRKLDGSVPSGAMETCKSEHGVFDLTGNFDEWVYIEKSTQKSTWAGLKGGWWGPLRNTCRPVTTNHPEEFIFYAVSFRCCQNPSENAMNAPLPSGSPPLWRQPKPPRSKRVFGRNRGWTPDDEAFSIFDEDHADIREEIVKEAREKAARWEAKQKKWDKNRKKGPQTTENP